MAFFQNNPGDLAGFRAGDRSVLAKVYRYYARTIDRQLRRLAVSARRTDLCQPSVIADLLQEIFVRAFSEKARTSYDGSRPYAAYLMVIARNCFVDSLRAQVHEILEDTQELAREAHTSPTLEGYDPKVLTVARGYLTNLSALLRSVYEARFVQGCSQEAAAAALGLSRRQLRTSEDHLRKGLRVALQRAGVSREDIMDWSAQLDFHSA